MKWLILIGSLIITNLAGFIGSLFTSKGSWYENLTKPSFNPPNEIFGPVWTLLYILMGISLYLILTTKKSKKTALYFFAIQLILNALWSIFFFGLKNPVLAFINIIILWAAILLTTIHFYKISKKASYLLIPYLAWVTFATVLNLNILLLN